MTHGRFNNPVVATLTGIFDIFRKQRLSQRLDNQVRIEGKTCLITGANSGLGYALAVEIAKRGAHVIMACRSQIPEAGERVKKESGASNVTMVRLDLSDIDSIHSFIDELEQKNITLDILILNAGVATPRAVRTASGLDEIFLVNYLSNYMLVNLLISKGILHNRRLAGNRNADDPHARVVFISSDSHQGSSYIDFEEFGQFDDYGIRKGMNNYSYYKLVLNTFAVEASRRLNREEVDISFNVICPGPVNTNIIRNAPWLVRVILKAIFSLFFQSPKKAAGPVIYMAVSEDFREKSSVYLHMFNEKRMDYKVYEEKQGIKLWEKSAEVWKRIDANADICEI